MTPSRLGALVIHGMGSQQPGFADGLIAEVSHRLGEIGPRVAWEQIYWADALEPRETALWAAMGSAQDSDGRSIPLDWRQLREFVLHNFGDATAYHRDHSRRNAMEVVHGIISDAIGRLNAALADPSAPIVVLAHSLGGHMMSNYIWDRQHERARPPALAPLPTLEGLITFGCNIPLFALTFESPAPIALPGEGVTSPRLVDAARWLNFLDRDDILGWPIKPLYAANLAHMHPKQRETVDRIEDHQINVGSPLKSWTPAAHDQYWTANGFTRPVAAYLTLVIEAMDRSPAMTP